MNYLSSISNGFQKGILFSLPPKNDLPFFEPLTQSIQSSLLIGALETRGLFVPTLARYVTYISPFVLHYLKEKNAANSKEILSFLQKHLSTLTKVLVVALAIVSYVLDSNLGEGIFLTLLALKFFDIGKKWLEGDSHLAKQFKVIQTLIFIPTVVGNYFTIVCVVDQLCLHLFSVPSKTIEETIQLIEEEVKEVKPSEATSWEPDDKYLEKRDFPSLFHCVASWDTPKEMRKDALTKDYKVIQVMSHQIRNGLFNKLVFDTPFDEELIKEIKNRQEVYDTYPFFELPNVDKIYAELKGTNWDIKIEGIKEEIKEKLASYQSLACVKNLQNPTLVKIKLVFLAVLQADRLNYAQKLQFGYIDPSLGRGMGLPSSYPPLCFLTDKLSNFLGKFIVRDKFTSQSIINCIAKAIIFGGITATHLYEWRKGSWKGTDEALRKSVEEDYIKILEWKNDKKKHNIEVILAPILEQMGILKRKL